jgi:hypothetical protein
LRRFPYSQSHPRCCLGTRFPSSQSQFRRCPYQTRLFQSRSSEYGDLNKHVAVCDAQSDFCSALRIQHNRGFVLSHIGCNTVHRHPLGSPGNYEYSHDIVDPPKEWQHGRDLPGLHMFPTPSRMLLGIQDCVEERKGRFRRVRSARD